MLQYSTALAWGRFPIPWFFRDSTLQFPAGAVHLLRDQFDSMPSQLPVRLEEISKTRVATESLALPRPMRVLTGAEFRQIFSAGRGWAEFNRRYPKQRGFFGLSPVAFSADSLDALVYYEYNCGGRCGRGATVWLSRSTAADRWRVRKHVTFWNS